MLKRELEPSRLGNALSDTTTRRVIIGVLGMLMILPLLTYTKEDYTSEYGIKQLFWFGRSNCRAVNGDFFCDKGNWITYEGWDERLRQFIVATRGVETDTLIREVLWMYIPDLKHNSTMKSIHSVPTRDGNGTYWTENPNCSGFTISDKDCEFRTSEMELVTYTPKECLNNQYNC